MAGWDMDWLFKMFEKGLFKLGDTAGDALVNAGENTGEHVSPGRIKDKIATARMMRGDKKELYDEHQKLLRYTSGAKETCDDFCWRVVKGVLHPGADTPVGPSAQAAFSLCSGLLSFEGYYPLPEIDYSINLSLGEIWKMKERTKRALAFYETRAHQEEIAEVFSRLVQNLLRKIPLTDGQEALGGTPLINILPDAVEKLDGLLLYMSRLPGPDGNGLFQRVGKQIGETLMAVSGINPERDDPATWQLELPSAWKDKTLEELVSLYLSDSPFQDFFMRNFPFAIPLETRFSHTHIVAGSGHGKTQLMQKIILQNLPLVAKGEASVIVIDSQGDMFHAVSQLKMVGEMANRVVMIDPTEIDYPPALNLFDFGLERVNTYNRYNREMLLNGAIDLCEYMFGALLEAKLTAKQSLIFRFLSRLMLVVPDATIETLRDFMQEPERAAPYIDKLEGNTREFFRKQFFTDTYDDTRGQILTRVWGVLENTTLERMFCNKRNKVNIFEAMNQGSLILINTAKDLLKQEGTEILGRFFIALICQAAQERATIDVESRMPTFVYIDEAHDYFDQSMGRLLEQARKYKVGLTLAHQHLDQFEENLRSTVGTNTAIKLVGGLSAKDARALAQDMRAAPDYLLRACRVTEVGSLGERFQPKEHQVLVLG